MKTLTTTTLMLLLVGSLFSQKFVYRTLNDVSIKPLGGMILDSAVYDRGTLQQVCKYFNKDGSLSVERNRGGWIQTEKRTKYDYSDPRNVVQLVDSIILPGGNSYWGISRRTYYKATLTSNVTEIQLFPLLAAGGKYPVLYSTRRDSVDSNGRLLKSKLDSTAKDGTKIRWIYEYTYGEKGTVQETKFESVFPYDRNLYLRHKDTLEVKAYARNHYNMLVEVDYFMTKTDTIVGYPFIFFLQPQPVPEFSKEQVVTTKDQYGNILTASYGGHTATFYYSKSANTSLFENKADNGLKVYPTIITSTLNITDYNGLKTVSVFNLSGVLVHKEEVENNSIDLYLLSKGMYIVSIETETGISNNKIVKQ